MNVRIVILNYQGEKRLPKCLPSIVEASEKSRHQVAITVLDNQSQDRGLDYVKEKYPDVTIEVAPENRVLCSYNDYLRKVDEPVVILLNNDIRVAVDFIDPLVNAFEADKNLFMAVPQSRSFDGKHYEGGVCLNRIKWGIFWSSCHFRGSELLAREEGPTMASGFGAFDRQKFLDLGGYEDLYLPGRLEDSDICLSAWRKGWRVWYLPDSIVFHEGGGSFHEKFGKLGTEIIGHRNSFLFFWKVISDRAMWAEHIIFIIPRIIFAIFTGRRAMVIGFFRALPMLPEALKRRPKNVKKAVLSDREIFQLVQAK